MQRIQVKVTLTAALAELDREAAKAAARALGARFGQTG
jgi:hypothetical protein